MGKVSGTKWASLDVAATWFLFWRLGCGSPSTCSVGCKALARASLHTACRLEKISSIYWQSTEELIRPLRRSNLPMVMKCTNLCSHLENSKYRVPSTIFCVGIHGLLSHRTEMISSSSKLSSSAMEMTSQLWGYIDRCFWALETKHTCMDHLHNASLTSIMQNDMSNSANANMGMTWPESDDHAAVKLDSAMVSQERFLYVHWARCRNLKPCSHSFRFHTASILSYGSFPIYTDLWPFSLLPMCPPFLVGGILKLLHKSNLLRNKTQKFLTNFDGTAVHHEWNLNTIPLVCH